MSTAKPFALHALPAALRQPRVLLPLLGLLAATAAGVLGLRAWAQVALDQQPTGYVAPLDFNDYNLASGSAVAYRGDFIRATWDGDLVAHNVAANGAMSVKWRARELVPAPGSRIIFTSTASGTGAAFRWSGSSAISAAQQAQLGDAGTGPKLLDWLRGDKTHEQTIANPTGLFRERFSTLGAIVHGRPYHDEGMVYVGANDGMLHAFDAATGAERWAYVPGLLFNGGRLASLATPRISDFPYGVDGSLAVGLVGSSKLLVGAPGAGAKGLFALDISKPAPGSETAAAAMAKWEITEASTGYANLGHVLTPPQLVKLNTGDTAVLVPNGLNGAGGGSSLFVVRASDGARLAEITAGTGPGNGLGGIAAVDRDANGTVDVVYAGDLKGTMWKFELGGSSLPGSATALYTPAAAELRPITAAPSVSQHPRGGLMVNWGTGRSHASSDLSSTVDEYLYGVWDSATASASSLVAQTLTLRTVTGTVQARTASTNAVDFASGARGWRITLSGGERLIGGDTLTDSGRWIITTQVPNSGSGQGAWLLQIDAYTGSAGALPFFDLNADGKISQTDDSDRIAVSGSSLVPVGKWLGAGVWSQPVLAQVSTTLDLPFLNFNANTPLPAYTSVTTTVPAPVGESGVYGGHFDFDIFYSCSSSEPAGSDCNGAKHVHEYDDKWDVVGVNMLNASTPDFNLSNAITTTAAPSFKILLANTNWSPAASLAVAGTMGGAAAAVSGQGFKLPTSPEGFLAATPGGPALEFTRATLSQFVFALPTTAFTNKDWGTGVVRSGLIPSKTGCVRSNEFPDQAWMDGAFTIQVVNASATAGDVQASKPNDSGGYRLKDNAAARAKLLAQYTVFWHHPNSQCKVISGSGSNGKNNPAWVAAAPADTSAAGKPATRPAGTADPTGSFASGYFSGSLTGGIGGTSTKYYSGTTEVLVTRTLDSNGLRQVLRNAAGGGVVSDARSDFGSLHKSDLQQGQRARTGRLGWKEIVR